MSPQKNMTQNPPHTKIAPHTRLATAAALLLATATATLLLSACATSIPDESQMRALRANAATQRLAALQHQKPIAGSSVYMTGPLTLSNAIQKALAQNLSLQKALLARDVASGRIASSHQKILPSLNASANYLRLDDPPHAPNPTPPQDHYTATLTLAQPLFAPSAPSAIRAAKLYREWTETTIRSTEEDVRYAVTQAYYSAVLSAHLLQVNQTALQTARAQLADEQARRRQGMASHYDELRAQVEVSNFQAETLQSQNNLDLAYTSLFRLIGASPESRVELTDPIPHLPETISFDDALRTALACRPDLATAEYALRLQQEAIRDIQSRYLPEITARASQSLANPDPHHPTTDDWGDEWRLSLDFSWNLFDGLARRGALLQARAELRQLELALRDTEETVVSTIRQLVLSLKTAEEFARSQSQNLTTAQEALRLVQVGLREGQNTPVEVMDAREALTTASANYYQSLYDHALARLSLQKAMGILTDGALPSSPVLLPTPPHP